MTKGNHEYSLVGASALIVIGIAGVVLYTQHSLRVKDAHDMQQAELHCHFARSYAAMDRRWRDSPAKIQQATSGHCQVTGSVRKAR